jgi:hypothetical protein
VLSCWLILLQRVLHLLPPPTATVAVASSLSCINCCHLIKRRSSYCLSAGSSYLQISGHQRPTSVLLFATMSNDEIDTGDKLTPADFSGVTSHRRCTDALCAILLWCMWFSMTGLGIYAMRMGDYRLILYPLDYDGNVCGTDYGGIDMTEVSSGFVL